MTRMAEPGRPQDDLEDDEQRFEDEGRRSIFSALWFRAILVVVVLGVVAAVAVPYVLELANQPSPSPTSPKPTVAARPEPPPPAPMVPPSPPTEAASPQAPTAAPAMEKPPAADKPLAAEKPPVAEQAPAPEKAAPAPSRKADTRSAAAAKESTAPRPKATSPAPTMQGQGAYFVQVGAFKSQDSAKRLATRLRELKYNVEETASSGGAKTSAKAPAPSGSPSAGDKYDVYVMGGTAGDINAKLGPKGLTSEPSAGGVVVKPSLPLRDAVALSKDLAVDGLKVQVRRSSAGAPSAPAPAAVAAGGDGLYRVRVGPFDDRAAATSTMHELQQRGYTPFIARAGQ
jgi:cell division protein FtsN